MKKAKLIFFYVISLLFLSTSASAALVDIKQSGNIVYFGFSAPNKIVRYDLTNQTFLAELNLAKVPTVMHISDQHIYIASHREVRRFNVDGSGDQFVRNTTSDVTGLTTVNGYLFIAEQNSNMLTINTSDLSLADSWDSSYSGTAYTGSNEQNAYYYRTTGVSPSDIHKVSINNSGIKISDVDSIYHGDYPSASQLYLNTSENKIYDNAGILYFAADLTYAGSLAGSIDGLTFQGDNPIALRGNRLYLFNTSQIEQGQLSLDHTPTYIAAHGETISSFVLDGNNVIAYSIDISAFELPNFGEPVDPHELAYVPDIIESDLSDLVYLYDKESLSIFRYSTHQEDYIATLPLINPATWMSYSNEQKRLYLGYPSGKITYFDITVDSPSEIHFVSLPQSVLGLLAVENYVFAVDASGAWESHYTFAANGSMIDSEEWRSPSAQYVWNPYTKRVYHRRDGSSPNDIEWTEIDSETGMLGNAGDSPYHGDTLSVRLPFRISPDGQLLLNGGGQLVDATSLSVLNSLSNNIDDAAWVDDTLITVASGYPKLQFWTTNYELDYEYLVPQSMSLRIFDHNSRLLVISQKSQGPYFKLYDLNPIQDTDSDGVHDLKDNCQQVSNKDQLDFDGDDIGDACDEDDDNDSISDVIELAVGLNPMDANDALLDLDSDGFSNLVEHLAGSNMNDSASTPKPISSFAEDFENGWPVGFYLNSDGLPWTIQPPGKESATGFHSTYFSGDLQESSFSFTGYFSTGALGFSYQTIGAYGYRYDLEILVDGALNKTLSGSSSSDWRDASVTLSEGVHTIKVRVVADYLYGNEQPTHFNIDNFYFSADSDGDQIADFRDNCPFVSNTRQTDSDNDGIGDSCDNDPYSQDQDGDGYGDIKDNCPDIYNPEQEDIDDDNIGDECDPSDDRPTDTDEDGVPDFWDNCPLVVNENQKNLDGDGDGDLCDTDIDGDGIPNDIEDQYTSLDKYDRYDAMMDSDNDGATNEYEVGIGHSPDTYDSYDSIDLLEYFPLVEYRKLYTNSTEYVRSHMKPTDDPNTFRLEQSDGYISTIQRRNNGIYLLKTERQDSTLSYSYEDYLIIPNQMVPGEVREVNFRVIMTDGQSVIYSHDATDRIYLSEVGETSWNGELYPSITIVDSSGEPVVFLKGIAEIQDESKTLDEFDLIGETSNSSDRNNNSNSNPGDSGGSGGSTETIVIAALILFVIARSQKRRPS